MQSTTLHLCKTLTSTNHHHQVGFHHSLSTPQTLFTSSLPNPRSPRSLIITQTHKPHHHNYNNNNTTSKAVKGKKDNVWSVDNELAQKDKEKTTKRRPKGKRMVRRKRTKAGAGGRVLVSSAMLVEVETVLQTQVTMSFLLEFWNLWVWNVFVLLLKKRGK